MTFDQWWATLETREQQRADKEFTREAFAAGAASRDAEVARLKTVPMRYRRMAFNAQLQDEITELVAALKPFGAIDLVESRLPAEFAMLILRARAAIAKVKGQS